MPGRTTILATGEIYHIFNRGVAWQPIFSNKKDYQRATATLFYYQNQNLPLKYSKFTSLPKEEKEKLQNNLRKRKLFLVEIIAYCFMPTHFHVLLKQIKDDGIPIFSSNFANSYTRYFNTKQKRNGPIFQGRFKAVRIETDDQLLHVERYIHLNPYTSYLVKNTEELELYPYSSLPEYLEKTSTNFCSKETILNHFKTLDHYRKFVADQADYQRNLNNIKHLLFEAQY